MSIVSMAAPSTNIPIARDVSGHAFSVENMA
jgi:hypothetical protein